jgi:hypothetical protein
MVGKTITFARFAVTDAAPVAANGFYSFPAIQIVSQMNLAILSMSHKLLPVPNL